MSFLKDLLIINLCASTDMRTGSVTDPETHNDASFTGTHRSLCLVPPTLGFP